MLRFLKDWTLPVAIGGGVGLYLLFALVPALAGAASVLGPLCGKALPVSLFLTLFITFSKVDFRLMGLKRWHVAVLAVQLVAVGALAWVTGCFSGEGAGAWAKPVAEAVLVCVIAPCATAMPVVAAKLGGALAQTTTFTLLSSATAALLIPAVFPMLEPGRGATFWATSGAILGRLAPVLLLPLLLGAAVRHGAAPLRRWLEARPDLGFHCWCVSLALTSGITAKNILHSQASPGMLGAIAALSLVAAAAQFAAGRAIGRAFGARVCAGQALFQKNTGLAIWIANAYLPPVASIGAGCYVLWQNAINAFELWRHGRAGSV